MTTDAKIPFFPPQRDETSDPVCRRLGAGARVPSRRLDRSLREWREGLYETRRNFLGIAARTSDRFDQTFALIQRTQMLEKTLRTQLSPQMSAALRFSRTLNQQVQ